MPPTQNPTARASRDDLLASQLQSLQSSVDRLTEAVTASVQAQAVHNAEQRALEKDVSELKSTMYGETGVLKKIQVLEARQTRQDEILNSILKALWIIITPLLSGIGVGIVYLILEASQK